MLVLVNILQNMATEKTNLLHLGTLSFIQVCDPSMDNQLSASQAQELMNTNLTSFLKKRAMILEKNKDQKMEQIEYPAQDHISMKMLSLNMVQKCNQAMGSAQG